jgi:hypothetical protein
MVSRKVVVLELVLMLDSKYQTVLLDLKLEQE